MTDKNINELQLELKILNNLQLQYQKEYENNELDEASYEFIIDALVVRRYKIKEEMMFKNDESIKIIK